MKKFEKLFSWQVIAPLALLFYAFSFYFVSDSAFNQDLGRHLKLGEIISKTGSVPGTNLFSYTHPNFPFVNHHYLFELFVYWGNQFVGLEGLMVIKLILIMTAITIVLIMCRKYYFLLLPIGFIFFHILRERVEFRPEIFSYLFCVLIYYLMDRYSKVQSKKNTYLLFFIPLLMALWVNMHIYFFLGFVIMAVFLVGRIWKVREVRAVRVVGGVLVASMVTGLVNPSGVEGLLYPLNVLGNYGYTIAENQSVFLLESLNFFSPNFFILKLAALISIVSVFYAFYRKRLTMVNVLLIVLAITMSFMHIRSMPYMVLLALPATLYNFGEIKKTSWMSFFNGVILCVLLVEAVLYLNGQYYRNIDKNMQPGLLFVESGKPAMDFVLSNKLPQPIFNNFDIGSYIIYRGYPEYRVFVDGRPEAYPKEFFEQEYIPMQENYEQFKAKDFKTVIFSHTDQTPWAMNFLTEIMKDQDWQLVYIDDFMVIFVRSNELATVGVTPLNISEIKAADYHYDNHVSYMKMAHFFLRNEKYQQAQDFASLSLQLFPDSPISNTIMRYSITQDPESRYKNQYRFYQERSESGIFW